MSMSRKTTMKIAIAVLGLLLVLAACTQTETADMTGAGVYRAMSISDDVTRVTLTVKLIEGAHFYLIDEVLPEGAEIVDAGTGAIEDPGHIKWLAIEGMGDTVADVTYTYGVKLPEDAGAFTGTYYIDGMEDVAPIIDS